MNRRSFLASILAAGVAPAVVGSGTLMPVRQLWTPPTLILYGDGIHDDGHALQTWLDGGTVLRPDGSAVGNILNYGYYRSTLPINLLGAKRRGGEFCNNIIIGTEA